VIVGVGDMGAVTDRPDVRYAAKAQSTSVSNLPRSLETSSRCTNCGMVVPMVHTTVAPRIIRPSSIPTPSAVARAARAFNTMWIPACSIFVLANFRSVELTSGRM
jgi:hypothetical protein